ncbi:MAG TPA: hypothetical protein VK167_04000 [Flavipsychrobacter sp.]|nr:hypothetical protein [Flavipsychrobacter sp.]
MKKMFLVGLTTLLCSSLSNISYANFVVQSRMMIPFGTGCALSITEMEYDGAGFVGLGQPIQYGNCVRISTVSRTVVPCPAGFNIIPTDVKVEFESSGTLYNNSVVDIDFNVIKDLTTEQDAAQQLDAQKQAYIDGINALLFQPSNIE